ncbi:MAG: hypothetical protein ACYSU7_16115, partial [Planctomycetota bacterium]
MASALATIALCACASTTPRPAEPTNSAALDTGAVSPQTSRLAEQARRDVRQLTGVEPGGAEPQVAARPRDIQWNQPASPRKTPGVISAAEKTPGVLPSQEMLASDPPKLPQGDADEEPGGARAEDTDDNEIDSDRLRNLIVEMSSELYRRGAYSDMPLRELLLIAATTLVTPDRALATEALPGLTDRERELLAEMQTFFTRIGRELAADGDPEAITREIDTLHRALITQPRLVISRAALCTKVGGFGDYNEFPP